MLPLAEIDLRDKEKGIVMDTTSDRQAVDQSHYRVLVNDEEQYSIWPGELAIPAGWREVGPRGDKESCLAYIETVWTDMRPLSLRKAMEADGAS